MGCCTCTQGSTSAAPTATSEEEQIKKARLELADMAIKKQRERQAAEKLKAKAGGTDAAGNTIEIGGGEDDEEDAEDAEDAAAKREAKEAKKAAKKAEKRLPRHGRNRLLFWRRGRQRRRPISRRPWRSPPRRRSTRPGRRPKLNAMLPRLQQNRRRRSVSRSSWTSVVQSVKRVEQPVEATCRGGGSSSCSC